MIKYTYTTLILALTLWSCGQNNEQETPIAIQSVSVKAEKKTDNIEETLTQYISQANETKVDSLWDVIEGNNSKTANTTTLYANYINRNKTKNNEAIALYKEAISLEPSNYIPYKTLGNLYIHYNMLNEALDYLTKANQLKPDDHEVVTNIGNIYFVNKNYQTAVNFYTRAIELFPNESGYFNRSLCYQNMGLMDLANQDYAKAEELKLQSNNNFNAD